MRTPAVIATSIILALSAFGAAEPLRASPFSKQRASSEINRQLETKLDQYVQAEMKRYKIPGVSLAILRDGKVSILKSYGFANVELGVPVKPETIFQSGSIGKQFTSAAVMLLVKEGKISLDDRISKYLPDTPDSWKEITVRNLLNHTSGLGDYPDEISLRRDYTEDEYLAIFKKAPLNFATGTKWDYSNVGYVTLGILIRKVTGKSYGDFLQERIFKPLGMTTARLISEADIVPNRAAGYRLVNGELKNQEWVSPSTNSTADGALYLSILDFVKWDEELANAWANKDASAGAQRRVLSRSIVEQIWAPTRLSEGRVKGYGFGWFTDTIHKRRVVFHGGAWQGFKSQIVRFLDEKLTIVFLANSWAANDFRMARGLAALFYPEFGFEVMPNLTEERDVGSLFRRVLMQLKDGKTDKAVFTSECQAQLFPNQARQISDMLNSLSLPVAVIHLSELVERREEGSLKVYRYEFVDIGETLVCALKVNSEGKIAGIELSTKVDKN